MSTSTYAITKLHVFSGSAYVNIPNITTLGGPNISSDSIEITSMDSVNFKEFVASPLKDPGTLDFSVNYIPSNAIHKFLVQQASVTSSMNQWKMIFSDNTQFEFSGSLISWEISSDNPASQVLTANASVQISGPVSGSY